MIRAFIAEYLHQRRWNLSHKAAYRMAKAAARRARWAK